MINKYYNIVPNDYQTYLENILFNGKFPWFFWKNAIPDCLKKSCRVDSINYSNPTQLKHVFLNKTKRSEFYCIIEPIIDFYLKASNRQLLKVHSAAVIMQHPVDNVKQIVPHVDFDHTEFNDSELITIIYYVTQANGGTTVYNEFCSDSITNTLSVLDTIDTKKGLIVEFNSNRFHSGVEPSDNIRVLVTIIMEVKKDASI